jgi:hypothetical protein
LAAIQANFTVFQGSAASLPKPFDIDPIVLKFKPDARPQSAPEPRWSHAHGKIVQKWAEGGWASGSLELCVRLSLGLSPPHRAKSPLWCHGRGS